MRLDHAVELETQFMFLCAISSVCNNNKSTGMKQKSPLRMHIA